MVKHCEDIELKTKLLSMLLVYTGKFINEITHTNCNLSRFEMEIDIDLKLK